jgi:hypothetical glycosyl hydrolase
MKKQQVISEREFQINTINKFASVMALGNGYLGLRATHEEDYSIQTRGMYVAGIYNRATANETSELVNLPDIAGIKIEINGHPLTLLEGEIIEYERHLNLFTGELTRDILWKSKDGFRFRFVFRRFVSKDDLHLLASKVSIVSLDRDVNVTIVTGIDAQLTNFGRQHLIEEKVRVFDEEILQGVYQTTESNQTIIITTACKFPEGSRVTFTAKNRQIYSTITRKVAVNKPFILEKIGTVYTSLDHGEAGIDPETTGYITLKSYLSDGYDLLFARSARKWSEFWDEKRVEVTSKDEFDQTAIDFALYHLEIMTPSHDYRFSVGAKGLTGEGYKGHVFWDTEIFILPFHLYTEPERAKKLLQYRYLHLEQAKEKAKANGYQGALFPWESAFTGKEETPEFAAINIRTGTRQKVASALAEHHIVADIAFAVVQYYENTKDEEFMSKEGLELLKETARFWISRTVEENGWLSIKDVIGPDEYTEHVDNNAYTNYMAHYNVEKALIFMEKYQDYDPTLVEKGRDFLNRLYLPKPNQDNIIPQDDTFLTKPTIDLSFYKKHSGSQSILLDYSRQEVIEMQILKQADVVMLLYLFPDLFPKDVVLKNLTYYEERTIHDSSLSKAIHAIVAARCGELETAYQFFREACLIDLGPNPHSSDEGIHAASLGSIWLATMFGFANISASSDRLSIQPKLPKNWSRLDFPFFYQGRMLRITITHDSIEVIKESGADLTIEINGIEYNLAGRVQVGFPSTN